MTNRLESAYKMNAKAKSRSNRKYVKATISRKYRPKNRGQRRWTGLPGSFSLQHGWGFSCQTASLRLKQTGGKGKTKEPQEVTCCRVRPRYLWTCVLPRLLRALVFRAANRFYPGVGDSGGSETAACWLIYRSKNAGLSLHCVLHLRANILCNWDKENPYLWRNTTQINTTKCTHSLI